MNIEHTMYVLYLYEIEHTIYASILTTPEHQQAQIRRKFCFYVMPVVLCHASVSLFMEGHVLITGINQKTILPLAKKI